MVAVVNRLAPRERERPLCCNQNHAARSADSQKAIYWRGQAVSDPSPVNIFALRHSNWCAPSAQSQTQNGFLPSTKLQKNIGFIKEIKTTGLEMSLSFSSNPQSYTF